MGEGYTSDSVNESNTLQQHILAARDHAAKRIATACACSVPKPRILLIDPTHAPIQSYVLLSTALREEDKTSLENLSWVLPEVKSIIRTVIQEYHENALFEKRIASMEPAWKQSCSFDNNADYAEAKPLRKKECIGWPTHQLYQCMKYVPARALPVTNTIVLNKSAIPLLSNTGEISTETLEEVLAHEIVHLAQYARHPILSQISYLLELPFFKVDEHLYRIPTGYTGITGSHSVSPEILKENYAYAKKLFYYWNEMYAETVSVGGTPEVFSSTLLYDYLREQGFAITERHPGLSNATPIINLTHSYQPSGIPCRALSVLDVFLAAMEKKYADTIRNFNKKEDSWDYSHTWFSDPTSFVAPVQETLEKAFASKKDFFWWREKANVLCALQFNLLTSWIANAIHYQKIRRKIRNRKEC